MSNEQFTLVPVDYSRPYDEQPECKRHVIGGYANLARHNMTLTINTIMQAIGMPLFNENKIEVAFSKPHRKKLEALDNIQKVNLQKRLYRHFPFFKRMKLEDEEKKSVQLKSLLKVMSLFTSLMADIRNEYTHYRPYNKEEELQRQLELKKEVAEKLQYLYENSCQSFKSSEGLVHSDNEVLSALRIPEDYTQVIKPGDNEYKKTSDFYFNPKISEKKKRCIKYDQSTKVFEKRAVRFVRNPEYQAYMMDNVKGMSDTAIIYFLCLFLEKKVSFELMDEVGFTKQIKFKGEHADLQLLYLKEIMCMNRIRMTKTKLDSEMTDTALALDMINELRKCPKPLYEVFSKEARDEFKDDATVIWEREHGHEAIATEEIQEADNDHELPEATDKNTPRSTFVRWEDRFPLLALKYIDLTGMFDSLRFQLRLGKYRFAFYQHSSEYSIDGAERLRILQKELHGFGRIQEVNETMKEKWHEVMEVKTVEDGQIYKEPDVAGQKPYVTDQNAQYAIDTKSHSIGIRWEGWHDNHSAQHYGDLDRDNMFIPNLPSNPVLPEGEQRQTNQSEPLLPPQCMLSLYELPAILFYHYLLKKYQKDEKLVEKTIVDYYTRLKKFLTDVSEGKLQPTDDATLMRELQSRGLKMTDIPDKLKKLLKGELTDNTKRMEQSALTRLSERKDKKRRALEGFIAKSKMIGTKENKFDKMRATIKTGSLGQLLARDIMEWLTTDTKARMNLTGQNYVAMQTALSMMGQNFEFGSSATVSCAQMKDIFIKANILPENDNDYDADLHHPFLLDVFDEEPTSIEDFYKIYLEKEISHIDYMANHFKKYKAKGAALYIPFLHCERLRWKNAQENGVIQLAARYLQRPLQLPNGLFTDSISQLLSEIATNNADLAKALEKQKKDDHQLQQNVAYMIRIYLKTVEKDHPQHFYNTTPIDNTASPYRHVYRIFKKFFGEQIGRSNQTTTPAYTIEEIRAILNDKQLLKNKVDSFVSEEVAKLRQQQSRDLRKYQDKQWKILKKQNEMAPKGQHFNVKAEVQKRVNEFGNEQHKAVELLAQDVRKKLELKLKKVNDNERTIRRYRTQDVLMLFMAREILKAKSQDKDFTRGFSLKYVTSDSLLDKPVDFRWSVNFKDEKKQSFTKTIEQKGMKMKNYGQFYKFASDHQRLASLLSRLPDDIFQRAEIENEFSYYDTNRSEVFRQVYIIESKAYQLKPELADDANAGEEWFYYIDKKTDKPRPKRNNFGELLKILAAGGDGVLDEVEKDLLQSTRNAFGHNTYDVDMHVIFQGKQEKMKVPEVANGIKDMILEQTEELKKNL